jgi:hypothetical protein
MYFRAFVSVPIFALTFDSVAGINYQLDYDCIHEKCGRELIECASDVDNDSLTDVKKSYCKTVASCIHQDLANDFADPASCLDGLDHSNMSAMELKMETCITSNGCAAPRVTDPNAEVLPILSITSVKEDCLKQQCTSTLAACNNDAVCQDLFECLSLHRNGNASECASHLNKIDGTQKAALECGWNNKCFEGSYKSSSKPSPAAVIADAPTLNSLPAESPTVVALSDSPSLRSKSSFMEVKPLSFLSLSTATEAELKAAEAQAERQAKEAEVAWEESRKNTNNLLYKVHDEIKSLNEDLEKTSEQEKKDLALLEENRKKEDAELEATEKKLKELANTKVSIPSSSFIEAFNSDDFLAPLRRAAQQARDFAKQIKEHSSFKFGDSSSFLERHDDKASKALSLAEQALKKLDADIAAQKKQLAEEVEKAKKEEQEAEARAATEFAPPSFLQVGSMGDLKAAALKAEQEAKVAEAAWEASRRKTQSLLGKVHGQIDHLHEDLDKAMQRDKSELSMLERHRKEEDAKLEETEARIKELASQKVEEPASFLERSSKANLDEILAPLRKAAEEAKHFAEEMRSHAHFKLPSAFIQTGAEEDKATKALSLAEQALKKLDVDIAAQKKELIEEEEKAKKEGFPPVDEDSIAASFLQVKSGFDPLSPQALADWRDRFELQLQKAREAAGIHTPMHSSLAQLSVNSLGDSEQLREDERLVEKLEAQYNQQMQKLKEDNAELLARAKEEMERAKEEEGKVKRMLAQSSLLQTGQKYDPAKEEAHIRELERKWIREAESIVAPPAVVQQDNELQALIEQQRVKEAEAEAQLEQMKKKLDKDIEIMHKDLASSSLSRRPASFLETGSKGPAEAALARAEADLQKLKKQLREETAKLNAMHFAS